MDIHILSLYLGLIYLLSITNAASVGYQGQNTDVLNEVGNKPAISHVAWGRQLGGDASSAHYDEDDNEEDNVSLQQQADDEVEDSDEETESSDDDYFGERRIRRDVSQRQQQMAVEQNEDNTSAPKDKKQEAMEATTEIVESNDIFSTPEATIGSATTASPQSNKSSVLILIRDALKKVTTNLPTEQVATNALQYFQLFEHFLQQTIEQVIDDDDDEDEESTTIKIDENGTSEELPNYVPLAQKLPEKLESQPAVASPPTTEDIKEHPESMGNKQNPVEQPEEPSTEKELASEMVNESKPMVV